MKQLKKLSALVAALWIGIGTIAVPAAALDIPPYELYSESKGTNKVSVAFTGLNTPVNAFQISFELKGPIVPKEVTWGNQMDEDDLKECDYDETTNTLNLYVVSDTNLVVNNRLEIGTILFDVKSDAPAKGQYELALKVPVDPKAAPGNIMFVNNANQAVKSANPPKWQGETAFTYQKTPVTDGGGSSGGSGGTTGGGGNSDSTSSSKASSKPSKDKDKEASEPVVVVKQPVVTPVTTGGGSTQPIVPTAPSSLPESSSSQPEELEAESPASAPASDGVSESASQPVKEVQAEQDTAGFPILPVALGGISLIVVAAVVFLKWKKVF